MPTSLELHLIFITVIVCSCQAVLTDYDKAAVLALHNQVRSKVSPTAMNMLTMLWDSNLEASAQAYANTCPTGHSSTSYGENLAWGWPVMNITDGALAWAAEAQNYNFAGLSCLSGKTCGHYTQMVWANTEYVGCAHTTCSNMFGNPQVQVFVCHYNSAGNWVGESAYIAGTTCGWCPSGYACNGNLCAKIGTFTPLPTPAPAPTTRRPRTTAVTSDPTTAAPTPAPTTPTPTTAAPTTPIPTTATPTTTPAPSTAAPTTPAPTTTMAPTTAATQQPPTLIPILSSSSSPTTTNGTSSTGIASTDPLVQILSMTAQQLTNVPVTVEVTMATPAPSTFVNATSAPTTRPRRISVV